MVAYILAKRKALQTYLDLWPKKIAIKKYIYSACHHLGNSELRVYVNLSSHDTHIKVEMGELIEKINHVTLRGSELKLGAYAGAWVLKIQNKDAKKDIDLIEKKENE